jgi:glycosyltransferase involved in cell wall biosynthesis
VASVQSSWVKVSVIIPAYNQGAYLGLAIQSVLEQTHQDLEILVIDDGSTDDTRKVANQFIDKRIKYIYQDNKGLSAARNTGIRYSEGVYLSFLDSDDMFLPEKIQLQVSMLDSQPELGFVAGQAIPIDESGCNVGKIFKTPISDDPGQLLLGNPLHVGSVMLRRSCQEKVGFFDETLRSYEDWDMWIRLTVAGCKMGWVAQPVSYYRFHRAQMVRNSAQMTTATFAVLEKTFHNPDLPETWRSVKDKAYSRAHLRAAMQAYYYLDYPLGMSHLSQAVKLDPALYANDASLLASQLVAFADSPKNPNPIKFLEIIYHHLPDDLPALSKRLKHDLSLAAIQYAFEAYQLGDIDSAGQAFMLAVRYQPKWLINRGVISLLSRSLVKNIFKFTHPTKESG